MSNQKTTMISFRIPDVDLENMDALVKKGKGGRDRTDFLRSAVVNWIGKNKLEAHQ